MFEITEDWIKKFLTTPRATPSLLERLLEHDSSFKATHKLLDWALDNEIEPEIAIVLILRRACDITEYLVRKAIFKVTKTASLLESLLQACLPIHDFDKLLYWAIDNDAKPEILEVLLFSTGLSHEMLSRALSEKQYKMTETLLDRNDEFRFRFNMLEEIAITDNNKGPIMDIFKKRLMRDSEENEYILTAVRDYNPFRCYDNGHKAPIEEILRQADKYDKSRTSTYKDYRWQDDENFGVRLLATAAAAKGDDHRSLYKELVSWFVARANMTELKLRMMVMLVHADPGGRDRIISKLLHDVKTYAISVGMLEEVAQAYSREASYILFWQDEPLHITTELLLQVANNPEDRLGYMLETALKHAKGPKITATTLLAGLNVDKCRVSASRRRALLLNADPTAEITDEVINAAAARAYLSVSFVGLLERRREGLRAPEAMRIDEEAATE